MSGWQSNDTLTSTAGTRGVRQWWNFFNIIKKSKGRNHFIQTFEKFYHTNALQVIEQTYIHFMKTTLPWSGNFKQNTTVQMFGFFETSLLSLTLNDLRYSKNSNIVKYDFII